MSCVNPGAIAEPPGLGAANPWLGLWSARAPVHCPVVFLTQALFCLSVPCFQFLVHDTLHIDPSCLSSVS